MKNESCYYYITFKVFSNESFIMASDKVDFYFYSMTCQSDRKPIDIEKVIENADWKDLSDKYIISNDGVTNRIVIEKLSDNIYYGHIIRSKEKDIYFKTDNESKTVEDIDGLARIGEKQIDLGHFVFVPKKKDDTTELLFLTEVGYLVPGMTKITNFFAESFSPYEFHYEPLKNIRMNIIDKITKKKLKSITIRFRKNPEIPKQYEQVEELLKDLGIKENYILELSATMRITKNTDKNKMWNVDQCVKNFFGNPLQKAIDDGIDLPAFLTNFKVEILDEDAQQSETIDILKKYDKVSINIDKMEISNEEKLKSRLSKELADKLGIWSGD